MKKIYMTPCLTVIPMERKDILAASPSTSDALSRKFDGHDDDEDWTSSSSSSRNLWDE